jgi:hypothetical protein
MTQAKLSSLVKFVAGTIFGGVVATLGAMYTAADTDKTQNQPRQIDVQQIPQFSWGSQSPVPNVQFTYLNTQTNTKIEQIVGTDVELYNYTDRDAPETQIAITVHNADGSLPVFVGARARDGGIEDFPVEQNIKPVLHDHTLAFSFKVPTVLRTDGGMGNRSFQLYFAGKVAPVLTVSAGAPGFGWRAWDGSHYQESQLAKLSPWQRFGPQFSGAALIVGALITLTFLLVQIPAARSREKNRMIGMTDVVDATLENANLKDTTDVERRKLAADVAFNCWTSIYESMKGLDKTVAAKPERIV